MGMMQQVLFHLRVPLQGLDEQAMQMALLEGLTKGQDGIRNVLLIVDEAQMLGTDLLDEIRMLSNIIRDGRHVIQTILVGTSKLEDPLADPQLESLSQRIVARCYLHPMTHGETAQYLRSMLVTTGVQIAEDAIGSVHHACAGVPRLINQLMSRSLDFAASQNKRIIDDACVQNAWADLQQLPSPMLEPKMKSKASSVEFGELDSKPASFEPAPSRPSLATSNYFDIEAILGSHSIDCFQADDDVAKVIAAKTQVAQPTVAPEKIVAKTTHTTIVPPVMKAERKRQRDELFGIDFSDEMLVNVKLADAMKPKTMTAKNDDPATDELSLHSDILLMSASAKDAAARSTRPGAMRVPPVQFIDDEEPVSLPARSVDVPPSMAIVWSDDEPAELPIDDRDMLVIEEDVTLMVDPPTSGKVTGAAMRQPIRVVESQYQNLFSRLRGTTK